jgi:hypothetical protein
VLVQMPVPSSVPYCSRFRWLRLTTPAEYGTVAAILGIPAMGSAGAGVVSARTAAMLMAPAHARACGQEFFFLPSGFPGS